jgi:hypothetical protein
MNGPDEYGLPASKRVLPVELLDELPPVHDPIKLAGIMVPAVDRIGEAAAAEIEDAAQALLQSASSIAVNLRELANAVREHSRIAGERIGHFCGQATTVIEGVRALQERLDSKRGNSEDHGA